MTTENIWYYWLGFSIGLLINETPKIAKFINKIIKKVFKND